MWHKARNPNQRVSEVYVVEQVGHFESNAAADGAAPSPFSPDMGLLLQPLPTPAPPSFGFAGERGAAPDCRSLTCEFEALKLTLDSVRLSLMRPTSLRWPPGGLLNVVT